MKTKSKKAKGRALQKWVVKQILDRFSELQPDDVRSTSMGVSGADVQLSPLAQSVFNFSVECKNRASFKTLYAIVEQAEKHDIEKIPLGVIKQNSSTPLVILYAEDFFDIIEDRYLTKRNIL